MKPASGRCVLLPFASWSWPKPSTQSPHRDTRSGMHWRRQPIHAKDPRHSCPLIAYGCRSASCVSSPIWASRYLITFLTLPVLGNCEGISIIKSWVWGSWPWGGVRLRIPKRVWGWRGLSSSLPAAATFSCATSIGGVSAAFGSPQQGTRGWPTTWVPSILRERGSLPRRHGGERRERDLSLGLRLVSAHFPASERPLFAASTGLGITPEVVWTGGRWPKVQ